MTPLLTPGKHDPICIGKGMTNREIGQRLGLAEQTIKNSVTLILAPIGVTRRAHAANARDGWLSRDTQIGPLSSNAARSMTLPLWLAQDHDRFA
ncbi:MAG TPA: helix-turn-helix transcriptional regulator [Nakamurella sp.]